MLIFLMPCLILASLIGCDCKTETSHKKAESKEKIADVIIIGAGMAGAAAACVLQQNNITDFIILEGSDRPGGRIKSTRVGGLVVELGATWIHGLVDNPVLNLAHRYNLTIGSFGYDWVVFDENGNNVTTEADVVYERLQDVYNEMVEQRATVITDDNASDMSQKYSLYSNGWAAETPIEDLVEYVTLDFQNAEPTDTTSLKFMTGTQLDYPYGSEERIVLHQNHHGFSSLVENMLSESIPDWHSKAYMKTVVSSIETEDEMVVVNTNKGIYKARYVIATFSLGVLQNKTVKFTPDLPAWKWNAIYGMRFASYCTFLLRFPQDKPWFIPDNVTWIMHASSVRGYFPMWQNFEKYYPGSRLLQGTVTHLEAYRINRMSDEAIIEESMKVLHKLLGPDIPRAEQVIMHRWTKDPLFHGGYANWPPGYKPSSHKDLQKPVGRVHFAGEAYSNNFGFIHGAMDSGKTQTENLLRVMRSEETKRKREKVQFTKREL